MPFLTLLGAAVTAALWYLTEVDRQSSLALDLVELGSSLGAPVWAFTAGLSLLAAGAWVGAWARARTRRRAPPPPARAEPRAAVATPIPDGADWYAEARGRAEALPLHPVGEVRFDDGWDVPFALLLRQATMEQARRRVDAFVHFLHGIPTPHKARVVIESSPDITLAHHHLVNAHLKRRFAPESYYVVEQGGGVDVVFAAPDPRWATRTR